MLGAIEQEFAGRESGVDSAEQRIAASLDRMAREIRNLWIGQQALFALVDVLANTFLTCIPEPPRDVRNQAVALGKIRHEQISQKRCMAMMGDSQAAMAEWLSRGHENRERAGVPRAGGPERRGKNELFAWPPTISTVDRVPALEVCARFRRAGRMTSPARLAWTWTHALTVQSSTPAGCT